MSVKSKAKAVGWWVLKHGWSLGATWLIDRYVGQGSTNRILKGAVDLINGKNLKPTRAQVQAASTLQDLIGRSIREQVAQTVQQQSDALRLSVEATIKRAVARGRK